MSTKVLRAGFNTARTVAETTVDVAGIVAHTLPQADVESGYSGAVWNMVRHALPEERRAPQERFGMVDLATSMFHTDRFSSRIDARELIKNNEDDERARMRSELMEATSTSVTSEAKFVWQDWFRHFKVEAFQKNRALVTADRRLFLDGLNRLQRVDVVVNGLASRLTSRLFDDELVDLRGYEFSRSIIRNLGDPLQFDSGELYSFLLARAETFVAQHFAAPQRVDIMHSFDHACHRVAEGWYPSRFSE